jgi:hypothetical protein
MAESLEAMQGVMTGMITTSDSRSTSYQEHDVLLCLLDLVALLSPSGQSRKFLQGVPSIITLSPYQQLALRLVGAALDGGEPLTILTGLRGVGRSTILSQLHALYRVVVIDCGDPAYPNLGVNQVNGMLLKIMTDADLRGGESPLVFLLGAEALFSQDAPMSARVAIPGGLQVVATLDTHNKYVTTILADEVRFFGRRAAVIDVPAPAREHLMTAFGGRDHRAGEVIDHIKARGAVPTFTAVKRSLSMGRGVALAEAVGVVTGRTSDLYRTDDVEPTPSNVMTAIRRRVFAQPESLAAVERVLKRNYAGMKPEQRLAGAFLFAGPTGTGKTEMALALSDAMRLPMLRIDLSEYAMPHTIHRLIGAPPSYIGFNDGAILLDFVRRHPCGLILLDEAEKASQEVIQLFLGMMDSGTIRGQKGDVLDCSGHWLIFTTNAGMRSLSTQTRPLGFVAGDADGMLQNVMQASMRGVSETFTPEFRNRLDAVVHYRPLSGDVSKSIVRKFVDTISSQVKKRRGIELTVSEAVIGHIAATGFSAQDGARSIRRMAESVIGEKVADLEPAPHSRVSVDWDAVSRRVVASLTAEEGAYHQPEKTKVMMVEERPTRRRGRRKVQEA